MITRGSYSSQHGLILAFDIGTTKSGISYCILHPGQIPEVRGVTRFPGQTEGDADSKVPSILYYDHSGHVKATGSEALELGVVETAIDEGWTKAEQWKLHLHPEHSRSGHLMEGTIPPLPSGKSAVDVLSDFIKYLFQCAKTYVVEHHMGFNWLLIEDSIEFVFTYPNSWEGVQQHQYRQAIEHADLIPSTPEGRSRVHLISDGDACLHYYVSSLSKRSAYTEPQGVVFIDAGGGTIELSMYSVTSDPISCDEIAPAECRFQGSACVSRRTAGLLKRKLQGSPHCSAEELDALTCEFDQNTMPTVASADKSVYLKIGTSRYNNPQYNIKRGALKLTGEEVTNLFDGPMNAIITAFEQQRQFPKIKISTGYLVGGLGKNEFFWKRLQSHFEGQGVKLSRPDNDINKAIANGALLSRINPRDHFIKTRVANATYGIPHYVFVDDDNPEHLRRKSKWERHSSGRYRIPGAFDPILRKGDRIDEQKEIRRPFSTSRRDQTSFADHQIRIMCYRGTVPNLRWLDEDASSFFEHCTIQVDLRKVAEHSIAFEALSGETYYQVHFNVIASFRNMGVTAQIAWWANKTEERAPTTIVYHDN